MSDWYRPLRADARLRLFGLPHAGGGMAEFVRWRADLARDLEVVPLLLPGHAGRLDAPPFRRLEPLVDAVIDAIGPALDRPWALYGHSLGAAVAFGVAATACARGLRPPAHLLLGARGGPGGPPRAAPIAELDDAAFLAAVQARYEPLPDVLLADRALLAVYLGALRADMAIAETAAPERYGAVPVPTTVFVGEGDATATPADAARWAPLVGGPFAVETVPGGHFFHRVRNLALLARLDAILGHAHAGAGGASPPQRPPDAAR